MKKYLTAFLGIALLLPAVVSIEALIPGVLNPTRQIWLSEAFIEETMKFLLTLSVIFAFSAPKKEWVRIGLVVALGFGITETLLAFIFNPSVVLHVVLTRIFITSTPIHLLTALITMKALQKVWVMAVPTFFIMVAFHALFNIFITSNHPVLIGFVYSSTILLAVVWCVIWVVKKLKRIMTASPQRLQQSDSSK